MERDWDRTTPALDVVVGIKVTTLDAWSAREARIGIVDWNGTETFRYFPKEAIVGISDLPRPPLPIEPPVGTVLHYVSAQGTAFLALRTQGRVWATYAKDSGVKIDSSVSWSDLLSRMQTLGIDRPEPKAYNYRILD